MSETSRIQASGWREERKVERGRLWKSWKSSLQVYELKCFWLWELTKSTETNQRCCSMGTVKLSQFSDVLSRWQIVPPITDPSDQAEVVWGRGYFKAGKQRGGTSGVKHVIDLLAGQVRQVVRLISHWADIKRGLQVSLCSLKQQSHGRIRSQLFQQNLMITFFFLKSVLLIKPLKQ